MQLAQIRTNTTFSLNYETGLLEPEIELIALLMHPMYTIKNKQIQKTTGAKEMRFKTTLAGINTLIGELQSAVVGLNRIEQLASGLNAVISANKPKN